MIELVFVFSSLFVLNTMVITNGNADEIFICEMNYLDVSSIKVYEIEEDVEIRFDKKNSSL